MSCRVIFRNAFIGMLFSILWAGCVPKESSSNAETVDTCTGDTCDAPTDTDADTDSDTDADTDSDTVADTDSDTDADTDSDTDADTDSDTDADTDSDTDADTDSTVMGEDTDVVEYDTLYAGPCGEIRQESSSDVVTIEYDTDIETGHFIYNTQEMQVQSDYRKIQTQTSSGTVTSSTQYSYRLRDDRNNLVYDASQRSVYGVDVAFTVYFYDATKRRLASVPMNIDDYPDSELAVATDAAERITEVSALVDGETVLLISLQYTGDSQFSQIQRYKADGSVQTEWSFEYDSNGLLTRIEKANILTLETTYEWSTFSLNELGMLAAQHNYGGATSGDTESASYHMAYEIQYDSAGNVTLINSLNMLDNSDEWITEASFESTNYDAAPAFFPLEYLDTIVRASSSGYGSLFWSDLSDGGYSPARMPLTATLETSQYDSNNDGYANQIYQMNVNNDGRFSSMSFTSYYPPAAATDTETDTDAVSLDTINTLSISATYSDGGGLSGLSWSATEPNTADITHQYSGSRNFDEAGQIVTNRKSSSYSNWEDISYPSFSSSSYTDTYTYNDSGHLLRLNQVSHSSSSIDFEYSNISDTTTVTEYTYDTMGNVLTQTISRQSCSGMVGVAADTTTCTDMTVLSYTIYTYDCWM